MLVTTLVNIRYLTGFTGSAAKLLVTPDELVFVGILKEEGILAVPGRGFGRPGYMRLSLTIPDQTIERALPGFERALAKAKGL